ARLEITFPGVQVGVFSGALRYTVFSGTNLVQQDILATTREPWVAYKYDAGLTSAGGRSVRVGWRDPANVWHDVRLSGAATAGAVPLKANGRIVGAERGGVGSIAAFPPPHTFFWAREVAINLGYNFYRAEGDASVTVGIRQAEREDESEGQANFALY